MEAFLEYTLFNYHMAIKNQNPTWSNLSNDAYDVAIFVHQGVTFLYFACSLFEVSDISIDVGLIF